MTIKKRLFCSNILMIAVPAAIVAFVGLLCMLLLWVTIRGGGVLHLEDGTQVWLQDGTELRYAVGKGDGERIVRLDGEAYFDVSHDARHPFVVETRELAIRVLGTI